MLSYELCKKLKDAGFPQKEENVFLWVQHYRLTEDYKDWEKTSIDLVYSEECDHDEYGGRHEVTCLNPTLSELIEACGEGFMGIRRRKDRTFFAVKGDGHIMEDYRTPEEAVANLYLALNE